LELTNESFFETGKSKYLEQFDELSKVALGKLDILIKSDAVGQLGYNDSMQIARKYLGEYIDAFHVTADSYKAKGFKNWGHEGELRKAIHAIENDKSDYDKVLMLTLRRHEKDFLLRKDLSYVEKFDNTLQDFKTSLSKSPDSENFLANIENYEKEFHNIIDAEKELGLTSEDGLKKKMRSITQKIEPLLGNMQKTMVNHVESVISNTYILLLVLFAIQLMIGVSLALAFSASLTTSIQTIKDRISKLSQGMFPEKIVPQTIDEIGEASHSLNNLIDRIQTAAEFAQKIGAGELDIEYDANFNNDVLANSLQSMHEKLNEASEDNKRRNWVTTGLANFGDIVRNSNSDFLDLGQNILSNLVKYLEANQGQLYMVQDKVGGNQEEYLELVATYAWGRKKFDKNTILKGEGTSGQVWIEKETIYLTEIPKDYVKISSGLGGSLPSDVLIVPMKLNEEVLGIIEIASFKKIEKYQIEFVEKLGEVIASTLSSVKVNTRTKELLFESQQQAEELRAQEEEMRQNTEEMQATQEELHRQRVEMEDKIKGLELELQKYKNTVSQTVLV
ncbi:MAG TPA: GAF domain-containing protein, partial [Cytophagaceae bacterium]|nr:GAF domain-containing protein [Cytophagaceae bacterium]